MKIATDIGSPFSVASFVAGPHAGNQALPEHHRGNLISARNYSGGDTALGRKAAPAGRFAALGYSSRMTRRALLCGILTTAPSLAPAADGAAGGTLMPVMLTLAASFFGALLLLALWSGWRQRRLLRELRRRETLFAAFFDQSPTGLAMLDRELRYVRANAVRERLPGASGALAGRAMRDAAPALAAAAMPRLHDLVVAGRAVTALDIALPLPEGERRWLVSWFPLPGVHGAPGGVGEIVVDVTERALAERALAASATQIKRLAAHREDEREREYRRLAREFHDELGQTLTGARLQLQLVEKALRGDESGLLALATIERMLGEAYRSVKTIAAELRPPALNLGLAAAIEWQAERLLVPAGIRFTLAPGPADGLDEARATTLFRIVQEALTNIVRYAGASTVHVSLRTEGAEHVLTIADDGRGFAPDGVDRLAHFGLSGMSERASALGGRLDIDSAPGEGTRIAVFLPVLLEPAA